MLVLSALVAIWFCFVGRVLGPAHSFAIHQDNEFMLGPILAYMSEAVRHGSWPLWMGTILGGLPLYSFPQLSAYYPFYGTVLPIFPDPVETARSMHLITLLHVLVFEINAYVLLRALAVSRVASVAGAVLIVFNANTLVYSQWINVVAPYAWLPLYLAGLVMLLEAKQDTPWFGRYLVLCLTGIVLLVLASPAQPLIHAVIFTVVLVAGRVLTLLARREWRTIRRIFWTLGVVAGLAMLLVAPVLLPVVAKFPEMIRWVGSFAPVYGSDPIPFAAFLTDQLAPRDLLGILVPMDATRAVGAEFLGALPIGFALLACLSRPRHWIVLPCASLAVYALLSSTGNHLGFATLNYVLPLINKIREPSRFLFLTHFSVGIIAAIGIDRLGAASATQASQGRAVRWIVPGVALVAGAILLGLWGHIPRHGAVVASGLIIFAAVLFQSRGLLLRWPLGSGALSMWSIVVVLVQLMLVPWVAPLTRDSDYRAGGYGELDAALTRIASLDPAHHYRVIFGGDLDKQRAAMLASYHGIRALNAYVNPAPRAQFEQLYDFGPGRDAYFRGLGARFLLCVRCAGAETAGYVLRESVSDIEIYEAVATLPRVYVAQQVNGEFKTVDDYAAHLVALDLRDPPLFVETGTLHAFTQLRPSESNLLERDDETAGVRQVLVSATGPGVLVLNEFYSPDWVISIDGQPVVALKVNGNQIGVPFPAGSHRVDFRYSPTILKRSWIFPRLATLAWIGYRWRRRRSTGRHALRGPMNEGPGDRVESEG